MGEFLAEFLEALDRRMNELKEAFLKTDRESSSLVAEWFRRRWMNDLPPEVQPSKVVAVDASMEMKQYATGINLIYARAVSLLFDSKAHGQVISRQFDIYPHAGAHEEARNLTSRIAENLEHQVALQAIEEGEPGILLLDGTLSTRHIASIFNFRRHGWFSVEYVRTYSRLLNEARAKGWTLVAVAKSSRSIPMRDLALREIFASLIRRLPLDEARKGRLVEAWKNAVSDPDEGVRMALDLAEKMPDYREDLKALAQLFYERHLYIADSDVIRRYVRGVGRTPAILVGAYTQSAQEMLRNLKRRKYEVAREVASSELAKRRLAGQVGKDLFGEAYQAVEEALNLPAYVTLYVRFREGDDPLKLEFPCWEVGKEVIWSSSPYEDLLEDSDEVGRILGVVRAGYGGPNFHNVWLERVDRKVKLRRGTVESLYERYLWRRLGEVVLHARGERRVTRL